MRARRRARRPRRPCAARHASCSRKRDIRASTPRNWWKARASPRARSTTTSPTRRSSTTRWSRTWSRNWSRSSRPPAPARKPWDRLHAMCRAYLDACRDPALARMLVLEAPVVLGWKTWCNLEQKYEVAAFARCLGAAGALSEPAETLAQVILGALTTGARVIATSADPDKARAEVERTIDRLLAGLRSTASYFAAGEHPVRLALGVVMRDLVALAQRRHARIVERDELARVLERRPDHVLQTRGTRGACHIRRLDLLPLRREMRPVEGDEERAIRAVQSTRQAERVVDIRLHHIGAGGGERPGVVGGGVAHQRAHRVGARRVVQDSARKPSALSAGRADHRNDPLGAHGSPPHFAAEVYTAAAAPARDS